jgi:hypothetical protein
MCPFFIDLKKMRLNENGPINLNSIFCVFCVTPASEKIPAHTGLIVVCQFQSIPGLSRYWHLDNISNRFLFLII